MNDGMTPVYVNSSFRTSSTWLWTKFRNVDEYIAYYEPLNENIHGIKNEIRGIQFDNWRSKHPPSAPYFLEYLPILQNPPEETLFASALKSDRFIPSDGFDGVLSAEETAYLGILINHAQALGRRPVLCFTRSLARAGALKRAFPGKSIFLHRNLFHQWASYSGQSVHGNNYFFDKLNDIIKNNRHDPTVSMLDDWFSPREFNATDKNNFLIFLLFHLYIYICAFSSADLVIDSTRIASNRTLREETEAELYALLGHRIPLDDAHASFDLSSLNLKRSKIDLEAVEQFLKIIVTKNVEKSCREFIYKEAHDAFLEWEKNEFYSSGMRGLLVEKIDQFNNITQKLEATSNQRNHLTHERDEARGALQRELAQHAQLQQDLAQIHAEYAHLATERDRETVEYTQRLTEISTRCEHLVRERAETHDAHQQERAQRTQLQQDLAQIHAEYARLATERDRETVEYTQRLTEISTRCKNLSHEIKEISETHQQERAQCTQLQHELALLHTERKQLQTSLQAATYERAAQERRLTELSLGNDKLHDSHKKAVGQRIQLQHDLTRLRAEHERLLSRAQATVIEKAAQAKKIDTLSAENKHILIELEQKRHDRTHQIQVVQQYLALAQKPYALSWPRTALGTLIARISLIFARRASRKQEWSTASFWYQALLKRTPLNFAAWKQYGNMQRELGHMKEAARAYEITLTAHPVDEEAYNWLQQINSPEQNASSTDRS